MFNFTLQRQGKHSDVDIIIFNLIKVKEILKVLNMLFSSDLLIFSIKPRQIINVIDREVMENGRQI
jgi:hypothetical protein